MAIDAVIFDLDGVLLDSEHAWEAARREVAEGSGGCWRDDAQAHMMGMSTPEWTAWMRETLGVPLSPDEIFRRVTDRIEAGYRRELPLLPGAREAVESLSGHWPLAVASSSSRVLIDLFLELSGLATRFGATVSSEEVARGKPAPDVFLEAARKIGVPAPECLAFEDAPIGVVAAGRAGMTCVGIATSYEPEMLTTADPPPALVVSDFDALLAGEGAWLLSLSVARP
jgi:HAD superfamily hydrolase (TIGR01509 family)